MSKINKYINNPFKYLGMTLTNQNCMQEEMESKLVHRMPTTTEFRIFSLPVSFLKYKN